MPRYKTENLV